MEDEYLWLENLDDGKVRDFISRENARFKAYIGELPNRIVEELKKYAFAPQLLYAEIVKDGYFYLIKESKEFKIKFRNWKGKDKTIVSSKDLGEDALITGLRATEDARFLAYYYSFAGADLGYVDIIDLKTKEVVDHLEGSIGNIVFLGPNKYYYSRFFRTEKTPDGIAPPASRIFLREEESDTMVFGEGIQTNHFIGFRESLDKQKIIVSVSYGWNETKIFSGPIDNPSNWHLIFDSGGYPATPINCIGDICYIISYDGGGMGRVITVKNDEVNVLIDEEKYPLRQGIMTSREILLEYLVDAASKIVLFDLKTGSRRILLDREFYTYYLLDSTLDSVLIKRETFWEPYQLLLYNGNIKPLDGYSITEDLEVSEGFVESHDKTKIHYFAIKRKHSLHKNAALIYGYGGFRISLTPRYLGSYLWFVKNGNIFVQTNLRGGSEYGEKWHRAGMRHNKINVFQDFIAVIKEFREQGYKIIAHGRSNGGLLVGATITMRPDLVDVAVIGYPVLDMLRFHKLYIGRAWIPEYGDPENPEDREYLLKYSPYHNIKSNTKYPITLVYTGIHDDRVHPAHALKFVARLKKVGAPVYLRVETKSGHRGATPEIRIKEQADILAFISKALEQV